MRAFLAAPLLGVGDSPKDVCLLLVSRPSNKSTNQGRPQETIVLVLTIGHRLEVYRRS